MFSFIDINYSPGLHSQEYTDRVQDKYYFLEISRNFLIILGQLTEMPLNYKTG